MNTSSISRHRRARLAVATLLCSLALSGCSLVGGPGEEPSQAPSAALPPASVATTDGPDDPSPQPVEPTASPSPAPSPDGPSTSEPEVNLSAPDVGPDFDTKATALLAAFVDAYLDSSYDDAPGERLDATRALLSRNHTIDLTVFNITPARRDQARKSQAVADADLVALELRLLARNLAIIEMDVATRYFRNGKVVEEDSFEYEATITRGDAGEWRVQDLSRPHSHDGD